MQRPAAVAVEPEPEFIRASLLLRVAGAFAVLALIAGTITLTGRYFGHEIAMAGHSDSTKLREVVIGNNVLSVPDNVIRFERARRDGVTARLDVYLRWPDMAGYSAGSRDDFNHAGGARNILFLTFQEQMMSRDMDGRFDPIYSALIEQPGHPAPGGLVSYSFKPQSGYLQEELVVGREGGRIAFVARCLVGPTAEDSLAPCERDIHVGDNLSLSYRFPAHLLGEWRRLDASVRSTALGFVRTGG